MSLDWGLSWEAPIRTCDELETRRHPFITNILEPVMMFLIRAANSWARAGIPLCMKTKWQFPAILLGAVLTCGPALGWSESTTVQENSAKQDMKDAGHESKNAAKDVGHGTKQGTKKVYHSTKRGTKKAWHKTKNTTNGTVNGAKEGAKQPE